MIDLFVTDDLPRKTNIFKRLGFPRSSDAKKCLYQQQINGSLTMKPICGNIFEKQLLYNTDLLYPKVYRTGTIFKVLFRDR